MSRVKEHFSVAVYLHIFISNKIIEDVYCCCGEVSETDRNLEVDYGTIFKKCF